MVKKISCLLIAITLFLGFSLSVNAKESNHIIDFSKTGSIKVTLHEEAEDTYVEGARITIYKIADVYSNEGRLSFKYTDNFSSCKASLDDMTDENLTEDISKCVTEEFIGISEVTNQNGTVTFDDLSLGLYFIKQTSKVEGYSNIDSFLVHTPTTIENSWIYDIVATPKTAIYKEIDLTVKKVWNTNASAVPSKVEIELYNDKELIDTIELTADENWTYTWENIEKSDKYSVKEINVPKGYKVTYSNEGNVFTVTNTDTLANTGQLYYSIIFLTILGSLCLLFGVIELQKGKHE